ncbi:hypothetical protein CANARDRAFT_25933, partial [[Candida] arabinofermentans NRRL YB-2248]
MLLEYSKDIEIVDFNAMALLRLYNTRYLKKIRKCEMRLSKDFCLSDLGYVLKNSLEHLFIIGGTFEATQLSLLEIIFDRLKQFMIEQKHLQVSLDIVIVLLDELDFNSSPKLKIPNLNVTLNITSTTDLKVGQLDKFISKSFGSEAIKTLTINFDYVGLSNEELKDASFVENLTQLKVLELYGDFKLGSGSRSPVLNLDKLVLSKGYANLGNVVARKMTLKESEISQNTIGEGVEELTETESLNWNEARLPLTLHTLNIENLQEVCPQRTPFKNSRHRFGDNPPELSFENNLDVFKDLINLKKLKIGEFCRAEGLELPSKLEHFEFKYYYNDSNYIIDTIDFDLPKSLKKIGASNEVLKNLNLEKFSLGPEVALMML